MDIAGGRGSRRRRVVDWDLHHGDCREVLAGMEAGSVQCCVTSPPYWGLRKYEGVEASVWGGKKTCLCATMSGIMEPKEACHEDMRDLQDTHQGAEQEDLQQKVRGAIGDSGRPMAHAKPAEQLGAEQHKLEGRAKDAGRICLHLGPAGRSEERRVGKECPTMCRSRWSPYH